MATRYRNRIVFAALLLAAGLHVNGLHPGEIEAAKRIAEELVVTVERRGVKLLYCALCGKGPFTPRGMMSHLKVKHPDDVEEVFKRHVVL